MAHRATVELRRRASRPRVELPALASRVSVLALVVGLSVVAGAAAAVAPVLSLGLVVAVAFVVGMLAAGSRSRDVALGLLVAGLVGYVTLGRGFSYIGVYPVYVGELLLAACVVATLIVLGRARFRAIHAALLTFMVIGAAQTLPYFATYGFDAARDGVTWIYCAFAIGVSLLVRPSDIRRAVRLYGWFVPLYLLWVQISAVMVREFALPMLPGPNVPIVGFKPGDTAVHLVGIAAFVLSGLYAGTPAGRRVPESLVWLLWLAAGALVSVANRGSMLALAMTASIALVVRPSGRWARPAFFAAALLLIMAVVNPTIEISDRRPLSFSQLTDNVASIFGTTGDEDLDGSRRWRLQWWTDIVDYTVNGPYFWTGKGFGINLANADGFQVFDNDSLRAPHNGHLEILARAGVPGLIAWIVLQASWLVMIVRAGWRARRQPGGAFWAATAAWLLAFWAAAMVNTSFDVYLQGPHGGIWFWSMFGLGIAVASIVEARETDPTMAELEADATAGEITRTGPTIRPALPADRG